MDGNWNLEDGVVTGRLKISQIPWSESIGNFRISVNESNTQRIVLSAGYNWGDADGTFSNSVTRLQKQDGSLQPTLSKQPYEISVSGGDQASGSWGGEAELKVWVR